MTSDKSHFLLLKQQVLVRAGLRSVLPGDCGMLSRLIFVQTKLFLSETTLKRVYGFAQTRFEASLFTRNALACFCGYIGWKEFLENVQTVPNQPDSTLSLRPDWQQIRTRVRQLARVIRQANRPCSTIVPEVAAEPPSREAYLRSFDVSGFQAAMICTWGVKRDSGVILEELERRMADPLDENIYLLVPGGVFDAGIRGWLSLYASVQQMTGLGYADENRPLFLQEPGHSFYLIIDHPEDYYNEQVAFGALMEQINAICQLHSHTNWFKLMLLTRFDTWTKHRSTLETGGVN